MNIFNYEEVKTIGRIPVNSIVNADCLEAMKYIADHSIDLILSDLPYG
jgi:DNA modification methylase